MANEDESRILPNFDIAGPLDEAETIAKTVDELGKQGLTERAFQSLLGIGSLIHEASILSKATAVVRRRDQKRGTNPD